MEKPKASKGYIVSHSHWDREWRYPLWENRLYLVELMEELMEHLEENPDYTSFLLDGQVVPVLDYLQVRPAQKERLMALLQAGRIRIGPWYTLPDLYPISGESMVRNLLRGKKLCAELGVKPLEVAYESFGWGQPSQLPQIYAGFGMDTVIVSKNVDKSRAPQCEFLWRGKDGTEVLATRLGEDARANFFMNTYTEMVNAAGYKTDDYVYRMGAMGRVFHEADKPGYEQDYFRIEDTQALDTARIKEAFPQSWKNMDDSLLPQHRLIMSGSDSTSCQRFLGGVIQAVNEEFEDIELCHSDLESYVALMKEKLDMESLIVVEGEMRDGPANSLSANALMTRAPLKQRAREAENLLFGAAEPLGLAAMLTGARYETEFLALAEDYLLLSHPHDSVNGVAQDKTADDVLYRLAQCTDLARTVANSACKSIISRMDTSEAHQDDVLLVAFNPLPFPRREVLCAFVDTPSGRSVWDFALEDMQGNRQETHLVSRGVKTMPVSDRHARPWPLDVDRHEILFDTGIIPAGGYKTYRVADTTSFRHDAEFWAQTRKTSGAELAPSTTTLENEYLQAEITKDGCLCLLNKETGRRYAGLNHYESTGDVGDYWIYYPPYHNETYSSKGLPWRSWLEENTPLQATMVVETTMQLPAHGYRPEKYHRGESRRSRHTAPMTIQTRYTLKKDARQLEVSVHTQNTAKDHRLRVLFDTGLQGDDVFAQGHFCVDARSKLPLKNAQGQYYNELTTQPMQNFVCLEDGGEGFAVVNRGMCEYEAQHGDKGTLALTMFRAVRNIICTEWRSASEFPAQQGGQLLQPLSYHYQLRPYAGGWQENEIMNLSQRVVQPVKLIQTCKALKEEGHLPLENSLYQLGDKLVLSALRKKEDSDTVLLRVYNPCKETVETEFRLFCPIRQAFLLDLNEENPREIVCQKGTLSLCVPPDKIQTFELVVE